jgi:hypothetical protein
MSSFSALNGTLVTETTISVKEARKLLPRDISKKLSDREVERIINLLLFIAQESIDG